MPLKFGDGPLRDMPELRRPKVPTIDSESRRKPPEVGRGQRRSTLTERRDELKRSTRFDVLLRSKAKTTETRKGGRSTKKWRRALLENSCRRCRDHIRQNP